MSNNNSKNAADAGVKIAAQPSDKAAQPQRKRRPQARLAARPAVKPAEKQAKTAAAAPKAAAVRDGRSKQPRGSRAEPKGKLRIVSLGGLHEIGKNMTLIEYGDDIVVVDCGIAFPDEDMLGIDLVIPDITYLEKNKEKIRGILLTHGHEDHIGSLPYVLRTISPEVYGTRLTLGIVEKKLSEHSLPVAPKLIPVSAGDTVKLGQLSAEFIRVNHSIADACAIAIRTPLGTVLHTGDFKLDTTPIDGKMMDITRLGEIGNEGVLLMLGESTNGGAPGLYAVGKDSGPVARGHFYAESR